MDVVSDIVHYGIYFPVPLWRSSCVIQAPGMVVVFLSSWAFIVWTQNVRYPDRFSFISWPAEARSQTCHHLLAGGHVGNRSTDVQLSAFVLFFFFFFSCSQFAFRHRAVFPASMVSGPLWLDWRWSWVGGWPFPQRPRNGVGVSHQPRAEGCFSDHLKLPRFAGSPGAPWKKSWPMCDPWGLDIYMWHSTGWEPFSPPPGAHGLLFVRSISNDPEGLIAHSVWSVSSWQNWIDAAPCKMVGGLDLKGRSFRHYQHWLYYLPGARLPRSSHIWFLL